MEEGTQHLRRVRWGDLVSPRAVYEFTLADAWGALPTLLAMAGFFIAGSLICFGVKKLLEFILLPRERNHKFILDTIQTREGKIHKKWRKSETQRYGSIVHFSLEILFFFGIVVAGLFAASIGNVNIWESAIASVGIGALFTYVMGPGLQLLGAGIFHMASNMMVHGEYWELIGQGVGGRVSRITPLFVEFMCIGAEGHGEMHRVPMTIAIGANWKRMYHKEATEPEVVMDDVVVDLGPNAAVVPPPPQERLVGGDYLYYEEEEDDRKRR